MGLRSNDLHDMVDSIFEIDSYKSKMGDDQNIVTLSFSLMDKVAAEDLSNFLEKGYSFILDSDVTAGEQSDGTYKVFVELERNNETPENIFEIMDGLTKLSGKDEFKFRYYKGWRSHPATLENMQELIPTDPDNYGITMQENALNNYKEFFSRSFLDEITLNENTLTIKKKWSDPLQFKFIGFGNINEVNRSITESIDIVNSYPEIMFLTKYIGDYNITKYGSKLIFENKDKALILERI
jgi:hypothetical protein